MTQECREYSEKPEGTFQSCYNNRCFGTRRTSHDGGRVCNELSDYSHDFLYNDIACYLTNCKFVSGPYIGQDLHINLEAPDLWRQRLQALGHTELAAKPYILEKGRVRFLSVLRK